jgi:hypothetical protein
MDLFKKVLPTHLNELIFYKEQINEAVQWITNYKNNVDRSKKVLLLIGDTGCGKTCIAHLLFKKFEYQIIELNSTDTRSQKKLGDFLHKTLGFNNILDMFYEKKRPIGLILDEIETLCQNNDKGGLSEFIQILKENIKYEKNKIKEENDKNKYKKVIKNDKLKVDMNKFIFIENPIICTYTNSNDKKVNELKAFSHVIEFKKISNEEYKKYFNLIKKKANINIELKLVLFKSIINQCNNDIRKFIQSIENIALFNQNKNTKKIDENDVIHIQNLNDTTKNDIQLTDAVQLFFNEKINMKKMDLLFYLDPYHLPYTVYQNLINFLEETTLSYENKLENYSFFLDCMSQFDKTNNLIYENNEWSTVDNSLKLYGLYYPNYYLHKHKFKVKKEINIEFTNIHNKASQMLVNKKLLSNAKYSLNKKYTSLNNIVLNCELLIKYFYGFRELIMNNDFNHLKKTKLIKYMNYYKINYDNLENILKIEKINKDEDKRKKNITVLLKEKIIENLDITLQN